MSKKNQSQILKHILEDASQTTQGLAIFDIDSTLLKVQNRILHIFKDFIKQSDIQTRFPQAFSAISKAQNLPNHIYFIEDHIHALDLKGLDDSFYEEILIFWKKHFFSNDYLKYDIPYPGALDFLTTLKNEHKIKIVYLTGRDEQRMAKGTYQSLLDLGFPLDGHQAQLILKPEKSMNDALFKKQIILEFDKKHKPIWFFENEPFIINPILRELPHIRVVFFDSAHSNKEPHPIKDVFSIQSFKY